MEQLKIISTVFDADKIKKKLVFMDKPPLSEVTSSKVFTDIQQNQININKKLNNLNVGSVGSYVLIIINKNDNYFIKRLIDNNDEKQFIFYRNVGVKQKPLILKLSDINSSKFISQLWNDYYHFIDLKPLNIHPSYVDLLLKNENKPKYI